MITELQEVPKLLSVLNIPGHESFHVPAKEVHHIQGLQGIGCLPRAELVNCVSIFGDIHVYGLSSARKKVSWLNNSTQH